MRTSSALFRIRALLPADRTALRAVIGFLRRRADRGPRRIRPARRLRARDGAVADGRLGAVRILLMRIGGALRNIRLHLGGVGLLGIKTLFSINRIFMDDRLNGRGIRGRFSRRTIDGRGDLCFDRLFHKRLNGNQRLIDYRRYRLLGRRRRFFGRTRFANNRLLRLNLR